MADKDYYEILELSRGASDEDIKKAYRALAMRYHPDRNRGNEEWAHNKFIEINEAFSVLRDPQKRGRYDIFGFVGNIGEILNDQVSGSTFGGFAGQNGEGDSGPDLLDGIFTESLRGTGYAFRAFRRRFDGPGKAGVGPQTRVDLEDLFEQKQYFGGSKPQYRIALTAAQARQGIETELVRYGKRLRVKIPAGVKSGSRIRLKNALLATDGQPGDISISVEVKEK
jgi:DnaJ-class molecular chaperone